MIGHSPTMPANPEISVVIPVRNEEESVEELVRQLRAVLPEDHEILFVDDGSTDNTWQRLTALHSPGRIRLVKFRSNAGKSAALMAGFARCTAPVVFTMDGDLQDDPAEIPAFRSKLAEGYDLVSGWKKVRRDPLHKVVASRLFNSVMRCATGLGLHDMNCGFKCYRAEVVKSLKIYGDQHRFIPVFAAHQGYRVTEIEVRHRARRYGRSKYGLSRLAKGVVDLGTVLLRTRFHDRPAHAFGYLALCCGLAGAGLLGLALSPWLHPTASWAAAAVAVALGSGALALLALGWVAECMLHGAAGPSPLLAPAIEDIRD